VKKVLIFLPVFMLFSLFAKAQTATTQLNLSAWNSTSTFNTPRSEHTSVAYNGYLYVIGGENSGTRFNDVQYAPINSDGSTGTWQNTTPFNNGRRSHTSVAYNGYLYVIGGAPNGGGVLNDVQYAPINSDGSLGAWQSTTSFSTGRLVHSSVVYNGYLYVIQGFYMHAAYPLIDIQYAPINANGSLGAWQYTDYPDPARWGQASIEYNGYIYSMGGSNWDYGYFTLNDVQYSLINSDGSLNYWQSTTSLNPSIASQELVEYDGYFIMTGGANIPNGMLNDVKFVKINSDGSLGAWQSLTSFNTARAGHTSVVYNGYLYVIGGQDNNGNVLNDVQYAKINGCFDATASSNSPVFLGSTLSLVGSPNDMTTYAWTGPNGFTSDLQNPSIGNVTVAAAGTYTLTATDVNGCSASASTNVIIISVPVNGILWTGNIDNNWHNAGNWNAGIPSSIKDVIIPAGLTNYPTLTSAGACHNIFLGSSAAGTATLLDNGYLTVNGTTTVQRYYSGNGSDYHNVSPPISNATANVFLGKYLLSFDPLPSAPYGPPDYGYTQIISPSTSLNVMEGYALYSYTPNNTASFVGNLNSGTISHTFDMNANNPFGWNLLGNPYVSSIDWNLVTIPATMNGEVHYINASTGADISYVSGGGGGGRYIPPMQGFFVSALGAGSLQFTDAVRTHTGAGMFYKSDINDLLVLEVSGNGYTNETRMYFNVEATSEHDRLFDAYKIISSSNPQLPQIYSITPSGVKLSINGMPETNMIPVGMKSGVAGQYTINATETSTFPYIVLEDLKTGIKTDLLIGSYTFNYSSDDSDNRFIIHFKPLSVDGNQSDPITIYSSHKDVYISVPVNKQGSVKIFNLMGQPVTNAKIVDVLTKFTIAQTSVYTIQVIIDGKIYTKKVIIQE
jgi:N-acetylneuraminic acid mutarotase